MKYFNKYIFVLLFAVLFVACNDDFLDRYPQEELSDGNFWKIPSDAEMFVADVYRRVLPGSSQGDVDGDINSDNAVHGIKWAAGNISKGVYDPADQGWSGDYAAIRASNLLIKKIDEIPNYAKEDKEAVVGEARFLRAMSYFQLIRKFGDVPYTDSPLDLSQLKIGRTPHKEVYDKLMEDFDYAIEKLPVQWSAAKYGRITKGAAHAMKARAALYFGDFETAAQESEAVISSNQYELFDKGNTGLYQELFWEKQESCKEAILVRQFKNPELTNYIIGWGAFPGVGWGGINPTQSLVDAFECLDGGSISQSSLYSEKEPFANRDPRLSACVLHDGELRYGITIKVAPLRSSGNTGIAQHNDATATGYYNNKYLDPSVSIANTWSGGKDWHVIRYAEVLLTYAEAQNKINPLDSKALDAVNQIRARVGQPDLQTSNASLYTYVANADELNLRIQNEWRVEFALEGSKRQWDIRRWGIAKKVLNEPFLGLKYTLSEDGQSCSLYEGKSIVLSGSKYEDHNYLYPIPQEELELNFDLGQNPNY
ncbi:membrane protein [Bacteroidales bacterium]|nr:membrane protein [Bacteroidales bacterium]